MIPTRRQLRQSLKERQRSSLWMISRTDFARVASLIRSGTTGSSGSHWVSSLNAARLPPELRRDLLRYLGATSAERARLIGELTERNPGLAELQAELEADDDLRARFQIELIRADRS
jgi:hypothetical protein